MSTESNGNGNLVVSGSWIALTNGQKVLGKVAELHTDQTVGSSVMNARVVTVCGNLTFFTSSYTVVVSELRRSCAQCTVRLQ